MSSVKFRDIRSTFDCCSYFDLFKRPYGRCRRPNSQSVNFLRLKYGGASLQKPSKKQTQLQRYVCINIQCATSSLLATALGTCKFDSNIDSKSKKNSCEQVMEILEIDAKIDPP